jgi:hypothetical protein
MKKIALALTMVSASAFAAGGDAGCGLGSLVMTKNTKVSQVAAATTNGTFGSQTFGITTGTSNCSATQIVMNDGQAVRYAEANFEGLKAEMARGEGENVAALANLMGCSNAQSFGSMTRAQFESIVPASSTTPSQMVKAVRTQTAHVAGCQG